MSCQKCLDLLLGVPRWVSLVLVVTILASITHAANTPVLDELTGHWEYDSADCEGPAKTWKAHRDGQMTNAFFKCGNGTQVLAKHTIPPSFAISEFDCSVRIKAARPGITLIAKVVFPETPNPDGLGPLTALIAGPIYQNAGRWETLKFSQHKTQLTDLIQERVWMLRRKHNCKIIERNAYIDAIYLNLYTTRGTNEVKIEDLTISGVASAESVVRKPDQRIRNVPGIASKTSDSPIRQVGYQEPTDKQPSLVRRDGSVLMVKEKPFFPRSVQHNGESFEFLKSIGFNVVELKNPANDFQLAEAEKLDIWIVCPAPPFVGLEPVPFKYDRVLAWSVGNNLTGTELRSVKQKILEIRQSDLRDGRPIVGNVESHWDQFGREVDVMSIGLEPLGTSFIASQYSDWIKNRSLAVGKSKPIWTEIQTEIAGALARQVATITPKVPPTPVEPQQMKFLLYEAITSGARGLRFNSRTPLDGNDPATRLRADTIRWTIGQALQLEPWIVGGALMGEVKTDNNGLEVTAINTSRSRLLLLQRPTHHEQYWAGDAPLETVQFHDNLSTFSDRVFQIAETGLQPMPGSRTPSGVQIKLEKCPFAAAVVLTQDPQVIARMDQRIAPTAPQSLLRQHLDITQQWVVIMQLVENQLSRMGHSPASASGAINEAINAFRKATDLAGNSPTMARPYLDRADERLAFARRELMTQPLGQFQSKTSSPLLAHISLVPLHWQLAGRLSQLTWNPNSLPSGDFERLKRMTETGWDNRRVDNLGLESRVELATDAAVDGEYGLKLSVKPLQKITVAQATPVWVSSAKVPVKAGQLVRIHGWVHVPRVIGGSHDGLSIMESVGGPELAERIPITSGWQEFTLYRGVEQDADLRVTFALTGIGEAMIDEVTVRTIDLPIESREARR